MNIILKGGQPSFYDLGRVMTTVGGRVMYFRGDKGFAALVHEIGKGTEKANYRGLSLCFAQKSLS